MYSTNIENQNSNIFSTKPINFASCAPLTSEPSVESGVWSVECGVGLQVPVVSGVNSNRANTVI